MWCAKMRWPFIREYMDYNNSAISPIGDLEVEYFYKALNRSFDILESWA